MAQNPEDTGASSPQIHHRRVVLGEAASPWTLSSHERDVAEIDRLLMAFAFDDHGQIQRARNPEKITMLDLDKLLVRCHDAAGMAAHGTAALLALWHAADAQYAAFALKLASHAQLAAENKELVRFLFQDILGQPMPIAQCQFLSRWQNPDFRLAVEFYLASRFSIAQWEEIRQKLPESLLPFYERGVAAKLPVRWLLRRLPESVNLREVWFQHNCQTLLRYARPERWRRLLHSEWAEDFKNWVKTLRCETLQESLLLIADPRIGDATEFEPEIAQKIQAVLEAQNPQTWLFGSGKKPPLYQRRQYFKYFCLFGKYNEAVRCFSLLGIFRQARTERLWYARVLFLSGMLHDAWAEVQQLLARHPQDAAVLNEAAIYAHKLGRFEEAAQLFATARSFFPNDPTIAYNEAVFTEKYSKLQIEEKWSEVQKLIDPPVVA
ncbi:MAG: hypothetical protein N2Z22_03915 [Turneriella sp.]|nr:hypothetical protein [Turneriella sp.]